MIESSNETEPLITKNINDTSLEIRINKESLTDKKLGSQMTNRDQECWLYSFNDIIDFQNIRDMWNTCTKPRSDKRRAEIWILFISLTLIS